MRCLAPCGYGSPLRRQGRCTSGMRGRRSTTGCSRAGRAASSCCGSRTPTASGRRPRTSRRSSTRSSGSGSTGTRGRSTSRENAERHAEVVEQLIAGGHAYRSTAGPDEVKAFKEQHGNRGFRGEDEGDRRRAPARARRGRHRRQRRHPRRDRVRERAARRPRDRPRGRHARLPPGRRGRRRRRRHHPRRPRRRPLLQHAQADADPAGDGRADADLRAICRCCTGPTARSSPSGTAPRRCRTCARPATCRRPS